MSLALPWKRTITMADDGSAVTAVNGQKQREAIFCYYFLIHCTRRLTAVRKKTIKSNHNGINMMWSRENRVSASTVSISTWKKSIEKCFGKGANSIIIIRQSAPFDKFDNRRGWPADRKTCLSLNRRIATQTKCPAIWNAKTADRPILKWTAVGAMLCAQIVVQWLKTVLLCRRFNSKKQPMEQPVRSVSLWRLIQRAAQLVMENFMWASVPNREKWPYARQDKGSHIWVISCTWITIASIRRVISSKWPWCAIWPEAGKILTFTLLASISRAARRGHPVSPRTAPFDAIRSSNSGVFVFADLLIDISDVLQICCYELGRTYLKLSQALCINLPSIGECNISASRALSRSEVKQRSVRGF